MTFVAAVITAVRLKVRLFRFCNSVAAVRKLPKVQPVLCVRQKRTRRNVDLVVSITLGILVYIVFSHRVVWSFQRQMYVAWCTRLWRLGKLRRVGRSSNSSRASPPATATICGRSFGHVGGLLCGADDSIFAHDFPNHSRLTTLVRFLVTFRTGRQMVVIVVEPHFLLQLVQQ